MTFNNNFLKHLCALLFSFLFLVAAFSASADEIWVSTSNGVYKLGQSKPVFQKFFKDKSLTAFKTEILPGNRALTAWGSGRVPVAQGDVPVAILELINLTDLNDRVELVKTRGKRIRDFVVDGDKIVAVGHFNGNVHFISLDTKNNFMINLPDYGGGIAHAIEKADLDRDGKTEYYITLTSPNVAGGLGQEGKVIRIDVNWKASNATATIVVDLFETYNSYAREIAIADLNKDGVEELIIEVSPQIEVYSSDDQVYNEPMRMVSAIYKNSKYEFTTIVEANIRQGRNLSIDDVDQDGTSELYFADYYNTGIYILESASDVTKAIGENVNLIYNGLILSRVNLDNRKQVPDFSYKNLKSNQVVLSRQNKMLWAIADAMQDPESARQPDQSGQSVLSMRLLNYDIKISETGYQLVAKKTFHIQPTGFSWHVFIKAQ